MAGFTPINSAQDRAHVTERHSHLAAAPNINPAPVSPSGSLKSSPTKSQHSPVASERSSPTAIGRLADLIERSPHPFAAASAQPTAASIPSAADTEQVTESVPDDSDVEMSKPRSASPTDDRSLSEAPSATAQPASSPLSSSSADSLPAAVPSSRASSILQDTGMATDDELGELDETNSPAHASKNALQSASPSETDSENGSAVEPEALGSPFDDAEEIWPDASKAKPISPSKQVVTGGHGRSTIPLYQYPTGNSGVPHIIDFLRRSKNDLITIDFIGRLQHLLWTLRLAGEGLGPSLVVLAQDLKQSHGPNCTAFHINTSTPLDLEDDFLAVGAYFRLHSDMARGIITSDVEALLLSASYGAVTMDLINHHSEGLACGRCQSENHYKAHTQCSIVYVDSLLYKGGCCLNCLRASAMDSCSFRRVAPKRRSVARSGLTQPLSGSNILGNPSSRLTRSGAGLSLVPATKPPYAKSSVAWTPEKAVNKFGSHLVKVTKGLPSDFRPEFPVDNTVGDPDDAGEVSDGHSSQVDDEVDEQDALISAPSTPCPPARRSSIKTSKQKTPSPRKKVVIREPDVSPTTAPRSDGPSSRTRSRSTTVEPPVLPSTPLKKATPRTKAVARKNTPRKKASGPKKSPVSRKKAPPLAASASSSSRADGLSSVVVESSAGGDAVASEDSVVFGDEAVNVEPAAEADASPSLLRSISSFFEYLSG
ncbi:hypothetical protein AG0111_0g1373 [Alternaria gaisen]|uniref:Uncharacterized protein n=1 Tax=Alternaria gaisen TaxID=167740 RepID=A0ACB6FYD5_9PLEO|nr:hypothetical protein AG0111_0g1373 [Alternaria gaisen]